MLRSSLVMEFSLAVVQSSLMPRFAVLGSLVLSGILLVARFSLAVVGSSLTAEPEEADESLETFPHAAMVQRTVLSAVRLGCKPYQELCLKKMMLVLAVHLFLFHENQAGLVSMTCKPVALL